MKVAAKVQALASIEYMWAAQLGEAPAALATR
jgi:hypothetical protein